MVDGSEAAWQGRIWHLVGALIPGEVDHVLMYVGPDALFVESGLHWDSAALFPRRGFLDRLYGVGYPLAERGLSQEEQARIRERVAGYCLEQAALKKPYNFVLTDPNREDAFYCRQLVYKAYLRQGILMCGAPARSGGWRPLGSK